MKKRNNIKKRLLETLAALPGIIIFVAGLSWLKTLLEGDTYLALLIVMLGLVLMALPSALRTRKILKKFESEQRKNKDQ